MAPKIRGVAPPTKRYKADLAVKKTTSNSQAKEPDFRILKLQEGAVVEVRLEEDGLYGSWHRAVICGLKPGLRQVEFKNLSDGEGNPVREWVRFGQPAAGGSQPLGTRKVTDGKPVLRPGGRGLPPVKPSFRKTGGWPKDLWVEVFSEEAWWEGVLVEDISAAQMDEQDSVVDVTFPQLKNLIEQVAVKNLRECKDWNEETAEWSIRGRLGKENDPMRTMRPGSPVCHRNGKRASGQDEESSFEEIEYDGIEGTGEESFKSACEDQHDRPATKPAITLKADKTGVSNYFGRLIEVVEADRRYLVRVQTLQYTLDQIQITVKEGFVSLDVTSESTETNLGSFICKVHNVCCALLELPTDSGIDYKKISWKLQNQVLTFIVPWLGDRGQTGKEVVPSPSLQS